MARRRAAFSRSPAALRGQIGRSLTALAAPMGPAGLDQIKASFQCGLGDALSSLVATHRLDAPFAYAMGQLGRRTSPDHLARIDHDRASRMRAKAAIAALGPLFDSQGIEWAVVKGPMVARYMQHPEHRAFNDLDVLVAPRQFGLATSTLIDDGACDVNLNWDGYIKYQVGQVPMIYKDVTIDLHWSLVGLGRWRRTMELDCDAMLRRRHVVDLGDGISSASLDDVDSLVHLCVHAAMSGAGRLDQLRDIAVVAGHAKPFDWDEFCRRSRGAHVGSLVAHALDRSALLLGAHVPDSVRRDLGGRPLLRRRWIDTCPSRDALSLRGLPVIGARDTWRTRGRAGMVLAGERLKTRTSPNFSWDFANPNSVLYHGTSAGNESTRAAFIDAAH